jgi:hypothetical protein
MVTAVTAAFIEGGMQPVQLRESLCASSRLVTCIHICQCRNCHVSQQWHMCLHGDSRLWCCVLGLSAGWRYKQVPVMLIHR